MTTIVEAQSDFTIHRKGCSDVSKKYGGSTTCGDFSTRQELIDWYIKTQIKNYGVEDSEENRDMITGLVLENLRPCTGLK